MNPGDKHRRPREHYVEAGRKGARERARRALALKLARARKPVKDLEP